MSAGLRRFGRITHMLANVIVKRQTKPPARLTPSTNVQRSPSSADEKLAGSDRDFLPSQLDARFALEGAHNTSQSQIRKRKYELSTRV